MNVTVSMKISKTGCDVFEKGVYFLEVEFAKFRCVGTRIRFTSRLPP
jgi:hypothetical protein